LRPQLTLGLPNYAFLSAADSILSGFPAKSVEALPDGNFSFRRSLSRSALCWFHCSKIHFSSQVSKWTHFPYLRPKLVNFASFLALFYNVTSKLLLIFAITFYIFFSFWNFLFRKRVQISMTFVSFFLLFVLFFFLFPFCFFQQKRSCTGRAAA